MIRWTCAVLVPFLAACGAAPTPPAMDIPPAPVPLRAAAPPTVTGGIFVNNVFTNAATHESCLDPSPPHCVSYTAALPAPPPGWELRVTPTLPVLALTGRPLSYAASELPACAEPLQSEVLFMTDAWPWLRSLPAAPFAPEPGAALLTVALCVRGEIRVQLGGLSGSVAFVPAEPPAW